ncbi:hypothetical protein Adt_30048 [Abeliophyllum distichum]|uniref:Uncharacterized protein n=1 Tax=Abeliophyllum distichum TaxID=126358 RepID=A0ABD1RA47_9LAMI
MFQVAAVAAKSGCFETSVVIHSQAARCWIWASMERFCSRGEWGKRELGGSNRNGGRIYTGDDDRSCSCGGLGHEERAQQFGDEWDVKRGANEFSLFFYFGLNPLLTWLGH